MSWLKFLGESVEPGPRGKIEVRWEHEPVRRPWLVVLKALVAFAGLTALWCWLWNLIPLPPLQNAALLLGGTLIYCSLAYIFRPEPEYENMGMLGGLVDHPFRWSDDWNRSLLSLRILLDPGRFVATSLLDVCHLVNDSEADADAPSDGETDGGADGDGLPSDAALDPSQHGFERQGASSPDSAWKARNAHEDVPRFAPDVDSGRRWS